MPISPTPDGDSITDNTVVHVIQSTYHHRDENNRQVSDDSLMDDEGWFADLASATTRCDQLNAKNQAFYATRMATLQREREAAIRIAETKNLEAAAIRKAGLPKDDVAVPPPFEPETFEAFFAKSSHTSYAPLEIRRSDHDGIAPAVIDGAN